MSGRREPLSAGAALRTVAGREIRERLRAKSFRIGTALLIVVIVGIGVIARLAGGDEPDDLAIGVVGDGTEQVATSMRDAADVIGRGVEVTPYDDVAAARAAVGEGDLDAAVLVNDQVIVFDDGVDDQVLAIAQQAWAAQATRSALADLGVADADIAAALTPARSAPSCSRPTTGTTASRCSSARSPRSCCSSRCRRSVGTCSPAWSRRSPPP
jgi:ABC-2 type transport system permease protein